MPRLSRKRYLIPVVAAIAVLPATLIAGSAGAAGNESVKCVGTADFCGATVSIAGGATDRVVTVRLTDTRFSRVGIRVIPAASGHVVTISKASFHAGGTEYRFTLNAVKISPPGSRIVVLFAAGSAG